jgi:hypothetical protein
MDERDLRKLSRRDLLEMLYEQTSEVERLRAENDQLTRKLEAQERLLKRAASLDARERFATDLAERLQSMVSTLEGVTKR